MASVTKQPASVAAKDSDRSLGGTEPSAATNLRHPLKFKRPPPVTQPSPATQSMLRRVSSAQNRNASVVESLQQFMASRSNSAARSSHGALSQNEETVKESLPDDVTASK